MEYYIEKKISSTFLETVDLLKMKLQDYGFGVVTEFDIAEKFKEKLDVDYPAYKVIGACNPKYAYEALQLEPLVGTMLPCNIVVRYIKEDTTQVAAIDPVASMLAIEKEDLKKTAEFIRKQLKDLVNEL